MALEIERKFLVVGEAWRGLAQKTIAMRHGYLNDGGRASVRVRLEGEIGKLNLKAAVVGAARAEYEYEIPSADAREILETLCAGLILKTRHYLDAGQGLTWEVDEFAGANAGLVVAEIELPELDRTFVIPNWLGREVTQERRYYNHALALRPYRDWTADERR